MSSFLSLSGLTKRYGTATVVDGLDLEVDRGELVCLLGPSGCSKTTTLRMIGGFVTPDAGRVVVDGQDVTDLEPDHRPVSTVFQSYALFPHLTVEKNVAFGFRYQDVGRREALARTREMLEVVGMADRADARVDEISGGQQQRVALARSLVLGPKVLLLDEPLSNLDAALRVQMRAEIRAIQRRLGTTMLFVTHDQEEAMSLGDRVAIMDAGRLRQVGAPEDVYEHPADEYCANFLGHVNEVPAPANAQGTDAQRGAGVVRFRMEDVRLRDALPAAIASAARGAGGTGDDANEWAQAQRRAGAFVGRVTSALFLGARRQYTLDVDGHAVTIRCDRRHRYIEGDLVSFDIAREVDW